MEKRIIPIAIITDNKLAFSVATLIVNLLETKNDNTFYDLNIVVTTNFESDNIDKIQNLEQQYKNHCSINFVKMDERFKEAKNGTGYISNACAFKMCFGELFPQYSKILYLDTDIIVFEDLSELYNNELDDNYIGGVFSLGHYLKRRELIQELAIPDLSSYINAGVLLLNLDKIRDDNIERQLQELVGSYKDSVDQHIFNKICYNKIKLLHPKYNITNTNIEYYNNGSGIIAFTNKEIQEVRNNPVIYHYTGKYKPWNSYNLRYALIWLRYYKKTAYSTYPLTLSLFISEKHANKKIKMKLYKKFIHYTYRLLYLITKSDFINDRIERHQRRYIID